MIQEDESQKSVFEEIPTEKIYSSKAIKTATFFAGILVGGYCIAENFKAFNDFEKARKTWIFTIISTILVIVLVFWLPDNFPSILFPAAYLGMASYAVQTYQEKNIQDHIEKGGETFSGWRTCLIGLISILIFLSLVLGASTLIDGI
ncbi:hypothetical protein ASE40_08835 [Flavobacterium sp. Root935]|uniref:hypothetical protein n=1 Tax=Flavobacterium sp. Root935 TaxID=1736610 RepID=UPI000708BFD7|nr:hypothetical protein [Flavobacterium sp. Root935]KRD61622.1 hypothetical protein ASE40_08835 [Flavobacterium sp. Root935]